MSITFGLDGLAFYAERWKQLHGPTSRRIMLQIDTNRMMQNSKLLEMESAGPGCHDSRKGRMRNSAIAKFSRAAIAIEQLVGPPLRTLPLPRQLLQDISSSNRWYLAIAIPSIKDIIMLKCNSIGHGPTCRLKSTRQSVLTRPVLCRLTRNRSGE